MQARNEPDEFHAKGSRSEATGAQHTFEQQVAARRSRHVVAPLGFKDIASHCDSLVNIFPRGRLDSGNVLLGSRVDRVNGRSSALNPLAANVEA